MANHKRPEERRKHKRFPIIRDLAEPIDVLVTGKKPLSLPGILTSLSAGGLDLILLGPLEAKSAVQLALSNIPELDGLKISGRIVWSKEKGGTTLVGIQFTQIKPRVQEHINEMAKAYWACEDRIDQGDFEICFRECSYWNLCAKTVKLKN